MAMEINIRLVKVHDEHWVGHMCHTGLNYENKVETKPVSKRKAWTIIRGFVEEQLGLVRSGRPKGGRKFGHRGRRRAMVDFVIQHGTVTHEELANRFIPDRFAAVPDLARYVERLVEDGVLKEWTDGEVTYITIHPDHRYVLGNIGLGGEQDDSPVPGRKEGSRPVEQGLFPVGLQQDTVDHAGNTHQRVPG